MAQKSLFSWSPLFPSCLKPFVQQALCLHTVESKWCYHSAWWKKRCYLLGFSFLYQRYNLGSCCTAAICLFSFYPLKYLYGLTCIAVCKGSPFEGTKASWSGQGEVLFFVVRHQYLFTFYKSGRGTTMFFTLCNVIVLDLLDDFNLSCVGGLWTSAM